MRTDETHLGGRSEADLNLSSSQAIPRLAERRPPALTALAPSTTTSMTSLRSPAVWVFQREVLGEGEGGCGDLRSRSSVDQRRSSLDSDARSRSRGALQRRWSPEEVDLEELRAAQAPSPRVLDNRLRFVSPFSEPLTAASTAVGRRGASLTSTSSDERRGAAPVPSFGVAANPGDAASSGSEAESEVCDPTRTSPDDRKDKETSFTCVCRGALQSRAKRAAFDSSPFSSPSSSSALQRGEAGVHQAASRDGAKGGRASPSRYLSVPPPPLSSSTSSIASGPPPPPSRPFWATEGLGSASKGSVPPTTLDVVPNVDVLSVEGLGPLMIVHLDALAEAEVSLAETAAKEAASGVLTSSAHPAYRDPYWGPLMMRQETETHEQEVAALYAKLEKAEQQMRVIEQQVAATAEARAAELVQGYKEDERKRRAQFQATLDALREENRDLTSKIEAAARLPRLGIDGPAAVTAGLPGGADAVEGTDRVGPYGGVLSHLDLVASSGVSQAELTRQLQAVETYWRSRLRNAEQHWEDEMTLLTRQRREALDQVEELVRTVEQSQEELRYTRRQAARLREENTRLCGATAMASSEEAATAFTTPGQVSASSSKEILRLRDALQAHEHREAALLAQVESYGEEAAQTRLHYEAALAKAAQELDAERRRSTAMVKLYGSQLESLHQQLREAKAPSLRY